MDLGPEPELETGSVISEVLLEGEELAQANFLSGTHSPMIVDCGFLMSDSVDKKDALKTFSFFGLLRSLSRSRSIPSSEVAIVLMGTL